MNFIVKKGEGYTLREWLESNHFEDLEKEFQCHAEQFTDEAEMLVRLIFISLRQELVSRGRE